MSQPSPTDSIRQAYNAVPYLSVSLPEAHLERLWSTAKLFGIAATSPQKCRVLELGCASGGHIIPLAFQYPKSTFIGVELSEEQAALGNARITELGLTNIEIQCQDLSTLDSSIKPFDYIIAHGLYSWVPSEVQDAILHLGKTHLQPSGVFYISFNTLPGWYNKLRVRDLLRLLDKRDSPPAERVQAARSTLEQFDQFCTQESPTHGKATKALIEDLAKAPDWYLLHEYLSECNAPEYFAAFCERATEQNLCYIADADLSMSKSEELEKQGYLDGLTKEKRFTPAYEQAHDLLSDRMMRRAILSPTAGTFSSGIAVDLLKSSFLASPAEKYTYGTASRQSGETFTVGNRGSVTVHERITGKALKTLGASWPDNLSVEELRQKLSTDDEYSESDWEQLLDDLVELTFKGVLLIEETSAPCSSTVSATPETNALTRAQVSWGHLASGVRGEKIEIGNALSRLITALLDGTSDGDRVYEILQTAEISFAQEDGEKSLDLKTLKKSEFDKWWEHATLGLLKAGLLRKEA